MALTCDTCGYRSNEVKSGAGVSEKGTLTSLTSLTSLTPGTSQGTY